MQSHILIVKICLATGLFLSFDLFIDFNSFIQWKLVVVGQLERLSLCIPICPNVEQCSSAFPFFPILTNWVGTNTLSKTAGVFSSVNLGHICGLIKKQYTVLKNRL